MGRKVFRFFFICVHLRHLRAIPSVFFILPSAFCLLPLPAFPPQKQGLPSASKKTVDKN
jgi:hypothetical protein